MRFGQPRRAHLEEPRRDTAACELPRGFAAGETGANHVDAKVIHRCGADGRGRGIAEIVAGLAASVNRRQASLWGCERHVHRARHAACPMDRGYELAEFAHAHVGVTAEAFL